MRQDRARDHDERLDSPPADPFEAAAWWHDLVSEGDLPSDEHDAFEAWLGADEAHAKAYEAIHRAWAGIDPAAADPRILEMRRDALAPSPQQRRFRRRGAVAAAAVVLATSAAAIWLIDGQRWDTSPSVAGAPDTSVFQTAVGERSTVTLSDGSTVFLNTATRLKVDFDAGTRRVRLPEGQAIFEVAHVPGRPFIVEAAGRIVKAVGTSFDVRVTNSDTPLQVTLLEGIVEIEVDQPRGVPTAPLGTPKVIRLTSGEQLVVSGTSAQEVRKVDVARATAWREGRLFFEDSPLQDAVAEVNRYSATKVVLASPDLGDLSVSGVFVAGKPDSFVETVAAFYGLEVTRAGDGQIHLAALE